MWRGRPRLRGTDAERGRRREHRFRAASPPRGVTATTRVIATTPAGMDARRNGPTDAERSPAPNHAQAGSTPGSRTHGPASPRRWAANRSCSWAGYVARTGVEEQAVKVGGLHPLEHQLVEVGRAAGAEVVVAVGLEVLVGQPAVRGELLGVGANVSGQVRWACSMASAPRLAPCRRGRPATSTCSAIAGMIRRHRARPYTAEAEHHSPRSPGGSSATRNGGRASRSIIAPAYTAVAVRSSGSATRSAPSTLPKVAPTRTAATQRLVTVTLVMTTGVVGVPSWGGSVGSEPIFSTTPMPDTTFPASA
jgi:hypothetical protein